MSLSSLMKEFYNPKAFFTHAALLDQGFPHCPIFPTAASRRSLGRVSVPVWLIILSNQLQIVALVEQLPHQQANLVRAHLKAINLSLYRHIRYQLQFPAVIPNLQVDSHMLLTRAPLSPKTSFDLHVLGMPPAFVLSHNQTLKLSKLDRSQKFTERPLKRNTSCINKSIC